MHAGFDIGGLFWVVVVVASIIGQIMKAAKKHTDAAPGSPAAPRPNRPAGGAPAQDLEEFLRNLMGEQAPRRAPPPMPAPAEEPAPELSPSWNKPSPAYRSATKSPTVAPRSATAEPPPARHQGKRAYRAVSAAPSPRPAPARAEAELRRPEPAAVPMGTRPAFPVSAHRNKIVEALNAEVHRQVKTPDALRAALLLREILGPPIALRRMNQIP